MKAALATLGVVAVLVAAWALLRETDGGGVPPRVDVVRPDTRSMTLPSVPDERPVPAAIEVAGASPGAPPAEAPDPSLARLEVLVVSASSGDALADLVVEVFVADEDAPPIPAGPTGGDRAWKEHRQPTDAQGRARFAIPAAAPATVSVRHPTNGAHDTGEVDGLAAGETTTLRLELPTEPDSFFCGRVVTAASGEPVAGARVRFFFKDHRGVRGTALELRTGPQGRFGAPLETWARRHGRVDAEGFGPRTFVLDDTHERPEQELVVRLARGATLRGRLVGRFDRAGLVVRAEAWAPQFDEGFGVTHPSPADLQREAPVSEDGRWELADLPPGAEFEVSLRRGETRVHDEPDPLFLQPGETRELVWTLGTGATLHGRAVLAGTYEPQAGLELWLVHAGDVSGFLATYHTVQDRAVTDDEGRFTFHDVPAGDWVVGPAPRPFSTEPAAEDALAPSATKVSISEGARAASVELRLHRGLFIRGLVLDPEGGPADGARVAGYAPELSIQVQTSTEDGRFRLGPLVPGTYRVSARGGAGAPSDPVTVAAGTSGVVLRIHAGGALEGRFVDASSGAPVQGVIQVVSEQERARWFSTRTREDGRFSFTGLRAGSYAIHGHTDTLAGLLEGVAVSPGSPVTGLEVLLRPGAALVVRYTGERTDLSCEVVSGTGDASSSGLQPGQTFRSVWNPGPVVVTLVTDDRRALQERTVALLVGEEVVVEFDDG